MQHQSSKSASVRPSYSVSAVRPSKLPRKGRYLLQKGSSDSNAVSSCISEYFRQYANRICSQTQLSCLRSSAASGCGNRPEARADDRGGQGELHGAGVDDPDDVAVIRRVEGEVERPLQPILRVHLDDLRKSPRESRYAGVTRGACVQATSSLLIARNVEKNAPVTIEARLRM